MQRSPAAVSFNAASSTKFILQAYELNDERTLAAIADESIRTLTLDTAVNIGTRTSITTRIACTEVSDCQNSKKKQIISEF